MNKIYDILFVNNFNLPGFFLMIGTVILFSIIINRNQNKYSRWFLLIFSAVFSLTVLIRTTSLEKEDYKRFKIFHDTGCLYEAYDERDVSVSDEYTDRLVLMHYFDNGEKQLLIHDSVEEREKVITWIEEFCPVVEIDYANNLSMKFSEKELETLKNHTARIKCEDKRFIVDNSWGESDAIIVFFLDGKEYFVSKSLFNNLNEGTYASNYLSAKYLNLNEYECLSELRGEKSSYQIILLVVMFVIGYLCCQIIFGNKAFCLSAFMAIPVFATVYCAITIVGVLIGISINRCYSCLVILMIATMSIYFFIKGKRVFNLINFLICLFIATGIISGLVYSKMWVLATDGYAKTFNGIMLSSYSLSKQEILSFMPFGMFDPIINCLGWNFHIDFLYAIYPIWRVCIIGTVIYIFFAFAKRTVYNYTLLVTSLVFFLTNMDILFNTFFIMSNGMIACMTLLFVLAVLIKIQEGYFTDVIIYAATMVIIITRVEGACYICLLLALFCGLSSYRKSMKMTNLIVSLEIVFWQGGLIFFSKEDSIFWDIKKGLMLIMASVALIILPYILDMSVELVIKIRKHYYVFLGGLLFAVSLFLLECGPEMAYPTAQIFAKHFATSSLSNSGAFWIFVLFSIPYVQTEKSEVTHLLLFIVIDYLMLTYMIFCFRVGVPIHVNENDSCRRIIQQIMPIAWLGGLYFYSEKKQEEQ